MIFRLLVETQIVGVSLAPPNVEVCRCSPKPCKLDASSTAKPATRSPEPSTLSLKLEVLYPRPLNSLESTLNTLRDHEGSIEWILGEASPGILRLSDGGTLAGALSSCFSEAAAKSRCCEVYSLGFRASGVA